MTESPMARVLVVEDDPVAARIVRDQLEGQNYALEHANDWTSVMEILFRFRPQVVVLDVHLPGVTGDSIAEILLDTLKPPPKIILHSSLEVPELEVLAKKNRVFGFLRKGCSRIEMTTAVREATRTFFLENGGGPPPSLPPSRPSESVPPARPVFSANPFPSSTPPKAPAPRLKAPPTPEEPEGPATVLILAGFSPERAALRSTLVSRGISVQVEKDWMGLDKALENHNVQSLLVEYDLPGLEIEVLKSSLGRSSSKVQVFVWARDQGAQAVVGFAARLGSAQVISRQTSTDTIAMMLTAKFKGFGKFPF